MFIACVVGAYLYRRYIPYNRAAGWVLGCLALFVIAMSFSDYGGLLTERVFGDTSNIDATEASSGRTEIWANMFATMFEQPLTFFTGFGWNVYWSFPFRFSPHNHYFALWFNLGLIGLVSGTYLIFSAIGRARRASFDAVPPLRGYLMAFVIGGTAVAGAVFFVDLHTPWIFFWMYTGVMMRLAASVVPVAAPVVAKPSTWQDTRSRPRAPTPSLARDAYGWSGTPERRT
jgi:hypothetical protein